MNNSSLEWDVIHYTSSIVYRKKYFKGMDSLRTWELLTESPTRFNVFYNSDQVATFVDYNEMKELCQRFIRNHKED